MESKETKHLPAPVEINVTPLSERNSSNNHGVYDLLYRPKEDAADLNIENKYSIKDQKNPVFGNVSTLDWLKTWRSLEIS